MGSVRVLDDYYLAITLLITIAYQLAFFVVAWIKKFDKLTDFAGGSNFVVLAIITLSFAAGSPSNSPSTPGNALRPIPVDGSYGNGNPDSEIANGGGYDFWTDGYSAPNARRIVASIFLMLWAARLAGFLLFRIIKTGRDARFDGKRDKFFPFLGFWIFQMLWVWTVSMPVTILNSPAVGDRSQPDFGQGCDIAGVILFALGLGIESIGDVQKYRSKSVGRGKGDKGAVCDVGVWAWSRHPNYFGEILVQFSIYTICVCPAANYGELNSNANDALYASIVGPLFLTILLLFVSGLPLNERPAAKKRYEEGNNYEGYMQWVNQTSILIALPPGIWQHTPVILKRTILFEWPMYVFDPAKHSDKAKDPEGTAEEGRGSSSDAGVNGADGGKPTEVDGADRPPGELDSSDAPQSRKPANELHGDGGERSELLGSEGAAPVSEPHADGPSR